jgi:hypothetical protein
MLLDQQNNNDNKKMLMLDACKSFLSGTLQLVDQYQLPKEGFLHIFNLCLNFLFLFGHKIFSLFLMGCGLSAFLVGCSIAHLNASFCIG